MRPLTGLFSFKIGVFEIPEKHEVGMGVNFDDLQKDVSDAARDLGESVKKDVEQATGGRFQSSAPQSTNAIVAVFITLLFGPVGAFFCWWLFAHYGFIKSLFYAIAFAIGLTLCAISAIVLVGYLLTPLLYIYLVYHVYRAVYNAPL